MLLHHPDGETPIDVGAGALDDALPALAGWLAGRTAFLLTTPRVLALHGERLAPLRAAARRWEVLTVPEGEAAKTVATAGGLWEAMLAAGGKRDSRLLALGGGSVGDLGGFVAGCFLRGISFVQLPTTLLAQVDAAVGGKTGVDLPGGKNTVGLFHHPERVVCDTRFLSTLPAEELRSGLIEVIKMAALLDTPLLDRVEGDLPRILEGDAEALAPVVSGAVAAKVGVVERDPTEQGDRRLLNFGHTLGHAIESACGYRGLRHGEAVAYGLLFALRLAVSRGLDPAVAARLRDLLARCELPALPDDPALAAEPLIMLMSRDKKAREGGVTWVLPAALGDGRMVDDLSWAEVRGHLDRFLAAPWAA